MKLVGEARALLEKIIANGDECYMGNREDILSAKYLVKEGYLDGFKQYLHTKVNIMEN